MARIPANNSTCGSMELLFVVLESSLALHAPASHIAETAKHYFLKPMAGNMEPNALLSHDCGGPLHRTHHCHTAPRDTLYSVECVVSCVFRPRKRCLSHQFVGGACSSRLCWASPVLLHGVQIRRLVVRALVVCHSVSQCVCVDVWTYVPPLALDSQVN